MINFEMIGYCNDDLQEYPDPRMKAIYPKKANFVVVAGKQDYHEFNCRVYEFMKAGAGIDVQMIDDPTVEGLAGLSDQRSYWKFGIPALMINDTSVLRNPNYHEMTDDIDTLDFDRMTEVVNCSYRAAIGL